MLAPSRGSSARSQGCCLELSLGSRFVAVISDGSRHRITSVKKKIDSQTYSLIRAPFSPSSSHTLPQPSPGHSLSPGLSCSLFLSPCLSSCRIDLASQRGLQGPSDAGHPPIRASCSGLQRHPGLGPALLWRAGPTQERCQLGPPPCDAIRPSSFPFLSCPSHRS